MPDEVLADLTADTVADVAEDEQAIEEAVSDEVIADAVLTDTVLTDTVLTDTVLTDGAAGGTPPADTASAIDEATEELVDLGGPEAAESVTPGSPVTDSAASDPLVPAEPVAGEQSAVTTPVEGYDTFSIPALRGHLRSYPAETVADLLDYERATRARAPYVTLLQNRLEKLSADRG
ncbi:hypothetical protein A7K94_0216050 [Modestobacter sp. VKM Ac-2676]|nr:hypothetical protein A7K94_0216050 [Modestobacter sp. VKM Ac-2676]